MSLPIERRLRAGLRNNTSVIDPDVERLLATVTARARPRVAIRRAVTVLALAAVVAGLIVLSPRALHAIQDIDHRVPPAHPGPRTSGLSGTFTMTLGTRGAAVRNNHMAGRWTIRLHGGALEPLHAPAGFAGLLIGYQYTVVGREFRTNMFISDVCQNLPAGRYRWALAGRTLRFTVVNDPCRARAALLASGVWQRS